MGAEELEGTLSSPDCGHHHTCSSHGVTSSLASEAPAGGWPPAQSGPAQELLSSGVLPAHSSCVTFSPESGQKGHLPSTLASFMATITFYSLFMEGPLYVPQLLLQKMPGEGPAQPTGAGQCPTQSLVLSGTEAGDCPGNV